MTAWRRACLLASLSSWVRGRARSESMFWITSVVVTKRPLRPGEQSFCLAASYLEESSCTWKIGAGGQALRSKPLVSCGLPASATVPVGHVELPFGQTREYSLQLFEPFHVHGSLHRPPPFVSRREPTRLGANCNSPTPVGE